MRINLSPAEERFTLLIIYILGNKPFTVKQLSQLFRYSEKRVYKIIAKLKAYKIIEEVEKGWYGLSIYRLKSSFVEKIKHRYNSLINFLHIP